MVPLIYARPSYVVSPSGRIREMGRLWQ